MKARSFANVLRSFLCVAALTLTPAAGTDEPQASPATAVARATTAPAGAATAPATQPPGSRPSFDKNAQEILLTSGRQVFAMRMSQDWSVGWAAWTWLANQCEEMAPVSQGWFLEMDDCKPVLGGTHLLATSSKGGVVLIRRENNSCVFYAPCVNAHSAELVRDRWIVACSSFRGNELQVFDHLDENRPTTKLSFIPLNGAHGAVYDWRTEILWALGADELLKTKLIERESETPVRFEVLKRYPLPDQSGHDLFPYFHYKQPAGPAPQTAKGLFVTVGRGVYVFDLSSETFAPFEPLAREHGIKSIGDNLVTAQIVYTKADPKSSFTTSVRFLEPAEVRALPAKIGVYQTRVYKVRWNQPNPFSYRRDAIAAGEPRSTGQSAFSH
jgi:hypothetical protein